MLPLITLPFLKKIRTPLLARWKLNFCKIFLLGFVFDGFAHPFSNKIEIRPILNVSTYNLFEPTQKRRTLNKL